eukprot:CCRYP_007261-RA/>CCRYP_007261-RA protein AED:0.02 eAED:0.02 QI:111/1/1/1/0/0/2/938/388
MTMNVHRIFTSRPSSRTRQLNSRRCSFRLLRNHFKLLVILTSISSYFQATSLIKVVSTIKWLQQAELLWEPHSMQTPRSFLTHPITHEEHRLLSLRNVHKNVTAAVCHPTLFGTATPGRFLAFVSYYRLLGFDHIFAWYEPVSLNWTDYDYEQIRNLSSYVTLTEYKRTPNDGYVGQVQVAKTCRGEERFAKLYDWILAVDADEFLWLGQNRTIKEFLSQNPSIRYFSFGKWQYGSIPTINLKEDSGFGLDQFPFTPKTYCYQPPPSSRTDRWDYCPDWIGRCKILSQPRVGSDIPVHGSGSLLHQHGVHYNTSQAHIKEWPGIAAYLAGDMYTETRFHTTFTTNNASQVGVHFLLEAYPLLRNGSVLIHFDDSLTSWFRFLVSNLAS